MFESVLNKNFEAEAKAQLKRAASEPLLPETEELLERKRYEAFAVAMCSKA